VGFLRIAGRPERVGVGRRSGEPDVRLINFNPVSEFLPRFVAIRAPAATGRADENLTPRLRNADKPARGLKMRGFRRNQRMHDGIGGIQPPKAQGAAWRDIRLFDRRPLVSASQ
jgi:hypothetical protein